MSKSLLLLFVSQLRDNDNIIALRDQESFSPSTPLFPGGHHRHPRLNRHRGFDCANYKLEPGGVRSRGRKDLRPGNHFWQAIVAGPSQVIDTSAAGAGAVGCGGLPEPLSAAETALNHVKRVGECVGAGEGGDGYGRVVALQLHSGIMHRDGAVLCLSKNGGRLVNAVPQYLEVIAG